MDNLNVVVPDHRRTKLLIAMQNRFPKYEFAFIYEGQDYQERVLYGLYVEGRSNAVMRTFAKGVAEGLKLCMD